MVQLGVNIDHVASVRQARYRDAAEGVGEPDPVIAVHEAELGGADIITIHLREDRRHINDRDARRVCEMARVRVNLEMGATDEMVGIAAKLCVPMVTLVPEGRQEVTTEGGLDVAGGLSRLQNIVKRLHDGGAVVSAFIDAETTQVDAARRAGFDACELHTGPFAEAFRTSAGDPLRGTLKQELARVRAAAAHARSAGLRLNAGHALNYTNVHAIAALEGISELHIGHSIISRAVFVGVREAVREMRGLIQAAARSAPGQ